MGRGSIIFIVCI